MNAINLIVQVISFTAILLFSVFVYGYIRAMMPPRNSPKKFIASGIPSGKRIVVCAGDSITHGRVSANYVDMLEENLGRKGFAFVNAGVNSELSWNLLQRVDEIVMCRPDYITILIGTNDAHGMISKKIRKKQKREMKIPRDPDEQWFEENLRRICDILKEKTSAKIALLSIPPIGEELESIPVKTTERYATIIRNVAKEKGAEYLPLHEKLVSCIRQANTNPKVHFKDGDQRAMYIAIAKCFLLGKSFEKIARENGFAALTDLLHLDERGAKAVQELIEEFLCRN